MLPSAVKNMTTDTENSQIHQLQKKNKNGSIMIIPILGWRGVCAL